MWHFVHLTDTHLGSVVDGEWNNRVLCSIMPEVMSCLRRDLAKLNPDLMLITGDIVSHRTRDAVFAARDFLDSLGVPYYPAGGNQDFLIKESRQWFIEAFQPNLPDEDTVYSFTHKNLHFCVLDPWWKWEDETLKPFSENPDPSNQDPHIRYSHWAIPPHELAWLEEDLDDHAHLPTIVATHYPAVPIPERLRRPGLKNAGYLDNGDLLIEVLERHPQVKIIMAGHVHMHFIEKLDGLTHVTTGSMPEFPVEYRDVRVYPDHVEIHTCGLSDKSLATRSLIPGKEWTAGQPQDRHVTILL